jgi:hypothetical protein
VPLDPILGEGTADPNAIVDPKARGWALLADQRYALLLGFLQQYLLGNASDRQFVQGWCIAEMKLLRQLSEILVRLPRGAGGVDAVAALPFSMPTTVALPADRAAQWQVHIDRLRATIAQNQSMQQATDIGDNFLVSLLDQDQTKLAQAQAAQQGDVAQTRWQRVRAILDLATGTGQPMHGGAGRFWNKPLAEFLQLSVYGLRVIAPPQPNRGQNSNPIKALKGQAPFDGTAFLRMPLGRPPVSDADITFISQWIDDDCPEN